MLIQKSTRKDKRFMATFYNGKVVHFGLEGGKTYIDEGDKIKRENYLLRHQKRENWNDPYTAGSLSKFITWGESTDINKNIEAFKKRFGNI